MLRFIVRLFAFIGFTVVAVVIAMPRASRPVLECA